MGKRVPTKDSLFDSYIRNTAAVLETGTPTGAVRLDLTTAQGTQWLAFRDQWIILYPKYTNVATRTTTIKNAKNQMKKDFSAFAEKPLLRIESSDNLTSDDRGTFNLPARDTSPSRRGAITDVPFGSLKGTGGGIMEIRARRESDGTRSSLHALADAVELRYMIVKIDDTPRTPPPPPTPGTPDTGDDTPTPENCPFSVTSKAAKWRINIGSTAQGKRVIGFLRWVNLSNPANNSGWSDLMTTIIS